VNFVALTRTGRTCCGYRWLVVLESKAAEMIRFRHYKEAGGKKTVLGKGNSHDNWTLRDDLGGRLSRPGRLRIQSLANRGQFSRAEELDSGLVCRLTAAN
jgi:hypothetical protein